MATELEIGEDKYVVIEGICDLNLADVNKKTKNNKKIRILYTGGLEEKYGIISLLNAIELLDNDNIELHICGSGTAEKYLSTKAAQNSNIILHGKVSNKQAIQLQINSDILINPRTNEGDYTKFSFPSKTIEYLVSGTPMIGYKLDGIPDEYDKYITYVNGSTIDDLAYTINKLVSMGDECRVKLGKEARNFIIKHKNPIVQMQRVESFLNKKVRV